MKKFLVVSMVLVCSLVFAGSEDAVRFHNDYVLRIKGLPTFFGTKITPMGKMKIKTMRPREYWNQVVRLRKGVKYMFIASADLAHGTNPDIDMILTDMKSKRTLQRTYKVAGDCCVIWYPISTRNYLISVHYNSGGADAIVAFRKYRLKD